MSAPAAQPLSSPRSFSLWFGLVGGGVAWLLHLLLAYVVAEFGCLSGLGERHLGNWSLVTWLLLAVSAGALGLALAATLVSWRGFRRAVHGSESDRARRFSARLGFISNVVFTAIVAVQSVPIFYFLRSC